MVSARFAVNNATGTIGKLITSFLGAKAEKPKLRMVRYFALPAIQKREINCKNEYAMESYRSPYKQKSLVKL